MSQEIFTFWNGDSLFAVEVSSILSTQQYHHEEKPLPVKGKGLKGALMYRSYPTPLFDFSEVVGLPSPFEENKKIIKRLRNAESEHVLWMEELDKSLTKDFPFNLPMDSHQCEFGTWFDDFETKDEDLKKLLSQLQEPHDTLHELSKSLLGLKQDGQKEKALAIFTHEKNFIMDKIIGLFAICKAELERMCKPVVMFVTQDGETPLLGLIINQIDDVQVVEDDEILDLAQLSLGSIIKNDEIAPLVKGFVSRDNLECLLIEPQRLLEFA